MSRESKAVMVDWLQAVANGSIEEGALVDQR